MYGQIWCCPPRSVRPQKPIPLTTTTGAPQLGHVLRTILQSGSWPGQRLNLVIVETYQVWTSAGGCRGTRDVLQRTSSAPNRRCPRGTGLSRLSPGVLPVSAGETAPRVTPKSPSSQTASLSEPPMGPELRHPKETPRPDLASSVFNPSLPRPLPSSSSL